MLDPDRMERNEREQFLTLFYESYIIWLVEPFTRSTLPDSPIDLTSHPSYVILYIYIYT